MSETSPFALPYLKEIFQQLRKGQHICAEDGNIYFALHDNASVYQDLFSHLGFKMEVHSRDFYYFSGSENLSDTSTKMALFIFILMEYLEGQGESVQEGILTKTFSINELPHFNTERYRSYMKEIGVEDFDGLAGIVSKMEKFGFAQRHGDTFRFRSPVYRFFDICSSMIQESEKSSLLDMEKE